MCNKLSYPRKQRISSVIINICSFHAEVLLSGTMCTFFFFSTYSDIIHTAYILNLDEAIDDILSILGMTWCNVLVGLCFQKAIHEMSWKWCAINMQTHEITLKIKIFSRKSVYSQTLVPLSSTHTALENSLVSLDAMLIPETLCSIINAKYITFQLTNCQALEISANAVPPAGQQQS